jgi:hypothetical protein
MSQLACIVSAVLYSKTYNGEGKIEDVTLFPIVGLLSAAWLLSFGTFLLLIKREYVCTFVSSQSGCDYQMSTFLNNEGNDAKRIRILFGNERKWRPIRHEVKQWVRENHAAWVRNQPAWFTDDVKVRIPTDFFLQVSLVEPATITAPSAQAADNC